MLTFEEQDEFEWSTNEIRMLRYMLKNDGLQFMRYFFRIREGDELLRNWYHYVIQHVLDAVLNGEISRLIINLAPGYTKTEQAVLNFIAQGLAINPRSKFIHASYSADLALENSSKIKETIELPEYQRLFPMKIKVDTKGKKRWFTDQGGGMMAASSGGQITGFRAGRMTKEFNGAFVMDDPVKPDDAYSPARREAINNRFNNTMRSRLAVESVPMVVIMQRIHEDDLSGYLLKGGSGDYWHHLTLPTLLDQETLNKPYPEDYTHGIPINLNEVLQSLAEGEAFQDDF